MSIIKPDLLRALIHPAPPIDTREERTSRIPYPTPTDVLYEPPTPDGALKRCGNCYKFVAGGSCVEVAGDIDPGQVCGLHVWGKPRSIGVELDPPAKVAPERAGLVDTPYGDGAACRLCRFFSPDGRQPALGLCAALGSVDGLPPVVVDANGCCSRWEVDAWGGQPTGASTTR